MQNRLKTCSRLWAPVSIYGRGKMPYYQITIHGAETKQLVDYLLDLCRQVVLATWTVCFVIWRFYILGTNNMELCFMYVSPIFPCKSYYFPSFCKKEQMHLCWTCILLPLSLSMDRGDLDIQSTWLHEQLLAGWLNWNRFTRIPVKATPRTGVLIWLSMRQRFDEYIM